MATITGTNGPDNLGGTHEADRIEALGGDDIVNGFGGGDEIYLGAGDDTVTWSGDLLIDGGDGVDLMKVDFLNSGATLDLSNPSVDQDFLGTTLRDVERVQYWGGNGTDTVTGGAYSDNIAGNDGDDVIDGGGGDDEIWGGAGMDQLRGGTGDDVVTAHEGGDSLGFALLDGGDGFDWLDLSIRDYSGDFTLDLEVNTAALRNFERIGFVGGSGVNDVKGGVGADKIWGGANDDHFEGRAGDDDLRGGLGDDVLLGGSGSDLLIGDGGADQIYGGDDDDFLNAGAFGTFEGSYLDGGAGNDSLVAREGADILVGGTGDDVLDGGAGADQMTGGTGNDIYAVDNAGDVVTENAGEGTDEVQTTLAVYVLAANVENLTAKSNVAHDFRGNAGNNVIRGGTGSDIFRLYDGGDDAVWAGGGNDNFFFGAALTAADLVVAGAGVDTIILQGDYSGGLTLTGNIVHIENISILGGGNTNFGEPGTNRYDYVLTTSNANFAEGVQARINGSALLAGEDFTFDGSAEINASFVVYGGRGVDTLTGGLGNDIFFFAEERFASGDVVNGGFGYDGMFLRGNYTIDFNAPGYTGLFTSIENLTLTSATDERYARGGGTEFDYNITLSNALVGAGGVLTVSGTILMASETMILDGGLESDGVLRLFGGKAGDTLKGGGQADLIHGNLGADTLAGNGGADTFRYDTTAESNSVSMDQILDFTPGTDKLDLSRIDARANLAGDQAFSWIGSNAFTGSAGQLRAVQQGGSWILEGDTNGDSVADLVVQLTLQGPTPLG
ncbi:MAG: M10 family metallopeptidase C-terminal domain-containing protein, partial [Allosphingosinicella sp.]